MVLLLLLLLVALPRYWWIGAVGGCEAGGVVCAARLLLGAEGRFPSHCSAPLARSARVSISRGGCRPGAHLRCPAPPAFLLAAGS